MAVPFNVPKPERSRIKFYSVTRENLFDPLSRNIYRQPEGYFPIRRYPRITAKPNETRQLKENPKI